MAPSASTSGGSSGPPRLQSVDDVIQLAVQVASSANPNHHDVATILVPALEKLMSLKGGYEVLLQASAGGQDPLSLLDPKTHSVAYLYILTTRMQVETSYPAPEPPATASLTPATSTCLAAFTWNFDARQIALGGSSGSAAGVKLTELARAIDLAVRKGFLDAWPAWERVGSLTYKLAAAVPGTITALDAIRISVGRRANLDKQVAVLEDNPRIFTTADRSVTPLEPADVLAYFFEAGQACLDAAVPRYSYETCTRIKKLQQAKPYLEQCFTAPAHRTPHDMQILALARWFLVSLGLASEDDGHQRGSANISLPGFTSAAVVRAWKRHSTPAYTVLADLYTSRRRSAAAVRELHTFVQAEAQMQVWQRDGTLALVTWLVEERHPPVRISRLAATFTRLKIKDVVTLLELGTPDQQGGGDEARVKLEKAVKEQIEKWITNEQIKGAKLEPGTANDGVDAGAAILSFHRRPMTPPSSAAGATDSAVAARANFSSLVSLSDLRLQMERLQRCNADLEARERDLARSKQFVTKMQSGAAMGRGGPGGMGGMGMGMSMGGMGGGGAGRFDMDDEDVFGA